MAPISCSEGGTAMRIGFIGTGTMGQPMLANLVRKEFNVVAFDIVPAALDTAVRLGAARAGSVGEAAANCDLVITMLPSSSNVEAVYLGSEGIVGTAARGRLCVDMSTIDPGTSQRVAARLKERGLRFLDAPVSGGAGEVAKLCNNLISGTVAVAVSEAFRIGEAFGVDPQILTSVIAKSSGATWVMEHMHPVPGIVESAASSRQYAPGFMTDLMAKDLGLAVGAAREKRVPVVAAPAAQQLYRMASSHGLGREDFSSVYKFLKPSSDDAPV